MEYELNYLAEFRDKAIEKEFQETEIQKGLRTARNMVLIFSIINLMFVISDYLFLSYSDITVVIYHSLIPRIIILILGIIIFLLLRKSPDKKTPIEAFIGYVLLMYLLHEYIAVHFAPVDLIFEALDLVILTFGLFVAPNRWITNAATAVLLLIIFIALTPLTIPNLDQGIKILISIYLFAHILVISILMYRINTQKRLNYSKQLQLEALVKTDVLTQSLNRAACDNVLQQMCKNQGEFSLILFDIDDFKQINDTYGHLAGDEVLVRIIDTTKDIIRQDDILARWGGEEFIIILPAVTGDRAMEIADRIKDFIARIDHGKIKDKVTASFGVTEFKKGDDTKDIINRADRLLYQAKEYGKNKVIAG